MPFLKDASAWLDATLATSDGETVRYSRGIPHVDVTAVSGQTPVDFDFGHGVLQTWQTQDFLIAAAALILSTHETTPCVGDEIKATIRSESVCFRVCNADDGRCFRYTDANRTMLRVHTKEI